jgi:hypothetical protein
MDEYTALDQKTVLGKRILYYGEPPGEMLEEITGKIGKSKPGKGSDAGRCKHLKFTGLAPDSNSIHVPEDCWEETDLDMNVVVVSPRNQDDISRIADQLNPRNIKFGDFREILSMLSPEIESNGYAETEYTS